MRPATIVGSAKGRSMIALTTLRPRKSSRTSTQAIIVPVTALIPTTSKARTMLSSSAETAPGLETTVQKLDSPPARDCQTTAAIGSTTITDRNAVTKPSERAVWALSLWIPSVTGD